MNIPLLREKLSEGEAYLIISPENRFYLTGFESSDGFLLITGERAIFFTDSRYIEAARGAVADCDEILQCVDAYKEVAARAQALGVKKIYAEGARVTVRQAERISGAAAFAAVDFSGRADRDTEALRAVKSDAEVKKILAAQRIAEAAFEHILTFIKPGVSEKEIALELDYYMLRSGAQALSFETIAVSGENGSKPHGVPGGRIIRRGDLITLDYGAVVDGYHSDMTRTVAVGEVTARQREIYKTVLAAQEAALGTVKAGVSCFEADKAARDVIAKAGFGAFFGHGTGHGVGVEIHEAPTVSPRGKASLEPGNVVTVEPGIYIPGECGVRIEDMALITADGCKNLTNCPKNLIVL